MKQPRVCIQLRLASTRRRSPSCNSLHMPRLAGPAQQATDSGRLRPRNRMLQGVRDRYQLCAEHLERHKIIGEHRASECLPESASSLGHCVFVQPRHEIEPFVIARAHAQAVATERSAQRSERRAGALDETDQIVGCPTRKCRARVRRSRDEPSRWPEPDPSSTQHEAKQHAGESHHQDQPAAQRQQNGRRHGSADPAHQAGCRVRRSGSAAKRWCQARNPRTTEAGESESHRGVDFPHRAR